MRGIGPALAHSLLWVGAVFSFAPFGWMLLTAIQDSGAAFDLSRLFAVRDLNMIGNFGQVLTETPVLRFLLNGFIVCLGILVLQLITALPCAYALAKLPFPGKWLAYALIILALTIPFQATVMPLFLGLAFTGLLDSYFALIFPFAASAFAILLLSQFLRGFPDEVIDAARLDGFSEGAIVRRLIVPAAWPAIAAFSVFSVTYHWNDLYWPLIVLTSEELAPPTLGILFFRDAEGGDSFGPLMAAACLITLPLVVLFLFAQKSFVQGITMTGLK